MNKKYLACIIMVLMAVSFSCAKKEAPAIKAVVTFVVGEASVLKNNAWKKIDVGAELVQNDSIKTGNASTIDIQIGQSIVRVKENSTLRLAMLYLDAGTGIEKNTLDLAVGTVLAKPKKLVKGESFLVKTPTAVAGVRGTMFVVEAKQTRDTRVSVIDGKVSVTKRIVVLENIERSQVKESEAIQQIERHLEENAVIVTENKACNVEARAVEEVNRKVERLVQTVVSEEPKKEEPVKAETATIVNEIIAVKAIHKEEIRKEDLNLKKEFEAMKPVELPKAAVEMEAAPQKSAFDISVNPGNASVFVNGELAGSGTVSLSLLPGTYTVRVQAEGYEDVQRNFVVVQGVNVKETIALQRLKPVDRVRWNLDMRDVAKTIVYSEKNVYIATEKGALAAIDRDSAKRIWHTVLASPITSGIVADGGMLYFSTADEKLFAVAKKNGAVQWSLPIEGAVIDSVSPVVTSQALYVATSKGVVYSFFLTGKMNWKTQVQAGVFETPFLVSGNLVISGSDGRLYSLRGSSGKEEWTKDIGSRFKLAYYDGIVYTVNYNGNCIALNINDGSTVWSRELNETIIANPIIAGSKIVAGTLEGKIIALARNDGSVIFRNDIGGSVRNNMVMSGDSIIVSTGATLYSLDGNGKTQWKYDTPSRIVTSASITGNEIYVGLDNGKVFSFNRNLTGTKR